MTWRKHMDSQWCSKNGERSLHVCVFVGVKSSCIFVFSCMYKSSPIHLLVDSFICRLIFSTLIVVKTSTDCYEYDCCAVVDLFNKIDVLVSYFLSICFIIDWSKVFLLYSSLVWLPQVWWMSEPLKKRKCFPVACGICISTEHGSKSLRVRTESP